MQRRARGNSSPTTMSPLCSFHETSFTTTSELERKTNRCNAETRMIDMQYASKGYVGTALFHSKKLKIQSDFCVSVSPGSFPSTALPFIARIDRELG